jgi:uncharacterized protein YegP (UPF0339 family)
MRALWAKLIGKPEPGARDTGVFTVYEAKDGWRWRLITANNRIVAESGEAYTRMRDAQRAARRVSSLSHCAVVEVSDGKGGVTTKGFVLSE